jgi:alpha-galactosidase
VVQVHAGDRYMFTRYAPYPIAVPDARWSELLIANADDSAPILLGAADETPTTLRIWDARGRLLVEDGIRLAGGPLSVPVPAGGLARLRRDPADAT